MNSKEKQLFVLSTQENLLGSVKATVIAAVRATDDKEAIEQIKSLLK